MSQHNADMSFARRHIGPSESDQQTMLDVVGYHNIDGLLDAAIPESIRMRESLDIPVAVDEDAATTELKAIANENQVMRQMIGLGYYGTKTPAVVRRNVFENPAWYTAYTPYQPEISQGRLEALLNFQTVVSDLTGLEIAGSSLLDEATAAAEAMTLARRAGKSKSSTFIVDSDVFPQTLSVLKTRAKPLGIEIATVDLSQSSQWPAEFFGVLLQQPGASGVVRDHTDAIAAAKQHDALVIVAADLLALTMLRSPGSLGADIAVGSSQRFGVPMGYGGPHAGYMSVRKGLQRSLPGRLVGVSRDNEGVPAYRLALQTREQHIRREKATSNICTAQVLLAVMASCYAVYHGPEGLREIAEHTHARADDLAASLRAGGVEVVHSEFFDTVTATVPDAASSVVSRAAERGINLRLVGNDNVAIACDETTTSQDIARICESFGVAAVRGEGVNSYPAALAREDTFLQHPVFHSHRSETAMMRYLRRLADKDFALDRGMIPLGSCTMKLNAASEMEPVSWPHFADIHPFAPAEQTVGYKKLTSDLESWLAEVTGYDAVSLQPNAGSQGELAGLLAIRSYHDERGDTERTVCLIPSSAHGTNAASAVMAGMRVVVVACDNEGNIDMGDLDDKIAAHAADLAAIMVTYPSTHGVYESAIAQLCEKVHTAGGQVYVDGANLNALLGFARPGKFGADVSHLNLHKTFCIPHGGGGPGIGPVAVREHLSRYLPGNPLHDDAVVGAVTAAAHGSASILPIPWMYLRMMGGQGLTDATATAVLAANYVAVRLGDHYPVLYSGNKGLVAHECILDLRPLTKQTTITVDDVAKRLIDYGFHAPTMSFPVAGTLMVEPTESEDLDELDRFCDAMIAIRDEIARVANGEWSAEENPLRNAPHTASTLTKSQWTHPYSREIAGYPTGHTAGKYWPPVGRIDGAYGDRNLACSCPPPEAFSQ